MRGVVAGFRNRTLAHSLLERVGGRVRGQLYLDRAPATAAVFLGGSPRSGTTWVAEQIADGAGLRLIFEPFHPEEGVMAGLFPARRYLRPSDEQPGHVEPVAQVLAGRVRGSWSDRYNRQVLPRGRLVKEVRFNLGLAWLRARFPWLPVAMVIRHPGAVAASQRSVPWDFHLETSRLLTQPELVADHLAPYAELLEGARSPVEQSVAVWAVENAVPLRQLRRGQVHLVCYEHLVTRPEEEFSRLFAAIGLPYRDGMLTRRDRPSGVTAKASPLVTGGDPVRSWQSGISPADRRGAMNLLARFGLDRLYGDGPMPLVDDPNELLTA